MAHTRFTFLVIQYAANNKTSVKKQLHVYVENYMAILVRYCQTYEHRGQNN